MTLHKYGGCQLEHISYEGQLKYKENQVRQVLTRIGKLGGCRGTSDSRDGSIHGIIEIKHRCQ